MPCSCFGKKDKTGGKLGEEEKYRPKDSREREPPPPVEVVSAVPATKSQTEPLLGGAPSSTGTTTPPLPATPSTPGKEACLRPEDDPDKASRRRDVVASYYSDQCELIGFKATGSRPPSAHVGGSPDGPAATSSPATSSPSSTRSAGAFCRADLAEKRKEFFRELAAEDDERPSSRLTDPGSQQTPRHSHYQDQLHHTLPHQSKTTTLINKFSSTPIVVQNSLFRNSTPVTSSEETEPLLDSPPEKPPKITPTKPDHYISSDIPNQPNFEFVSGSEFHDNVSDEMTPLLLSDNTYTLPTHMHVTVESSSSSISTKVPQGSPEMFVKVEDPSSLENKDGMNDDSESNHLGLLVDLSSSDNVKRSGINDQIEFNEVPSIEINQMNEKPSPKVSECLDFDFQQSSVPVEFFSNTNSQEAVIDLSTPQSQQFIVDASLSGMEVKGLDRSLSAEMAQLPDLLAGDSHQENVQFSPISSKTDDAHFVQFDSPFSFEQTPIQPQDNHVNLEFSSNPFSSQTLPVIINETLKEQHPQEEHQPLSFEITPPQNTHMFFKENTHGEQQPPQTFVETTRQFISGSPDEQKTSQTIVETTRQYITGPPEQQTTQTVIETTQQFNSGSPDNDDHHHDDDDEHQSSKTIVETTRQFITGIPGEDETQKFMEQAQQQFQQQFQLASSPDEQTIVKTTQHQFVSDDPDDDGPFTQTIIKTTQQIVANDPDGQQRTQTIVKTNHSSLPVSVDSCFLTNVEEPDELPDKLLVQTSTTTTSVSPQSQVFEIHEDDHFIEPKLPEVPCFGAPPPPSSPPPPLPEGHVIEDPFAAPISVVIPPGEVEPLPPAPPTPPAEQPQETSQSSFEDQHASLTPPSPTPALPSSGEKEEELPPAPPTPPTPRLEDIQLLPSSSSPPMDNEHLPPTPPTPLREEDELSPPTPPAPLSPSKEKEEKEKLLAPAPPTITMSAPGVTCGVEIVSSSALEDDGLGSEIDDALESLEGLSEEGNTERAAASS